MPRESGAIQLMLKCIRIALPQQTNFMVVLKGVSTTQRNKPDAHSLSPTPAPTRT